MSVPTPTGRAIAAMLGLVLSSSAVYYMMSDYQLVCLLLLTYSISMTNFIFQIKREDRPIQFDENGKPIKPTFKVSFREMAPLQLKPEAKLRLQEQEEFKRLQQERLELEKQLKESREEK